MAEEEQQENQEQAPSLIMDNDAPAQEPHPLQQDGVADVEGDENQEDNTEEEEPKPEVKEAPQQPPQPQQPEALEDPGEFKPNDYSFDIQLADGATLRIEKPEDITKIPQDADFGTPKNFLDVQAKYAQMVNGIESDKKSYEERKTAYDEQVEQQQQFETRIQTLMNELSYLESNGDIPPLPKQYEEANWKDPEVAKQTGVKERIELMNFRKEENDKRAKASLPPIGLLDAKAQMENKAFKEAAAQREQKQNDMRKQRGAMVTGASAPTPGSANSDMIVGSGGSLRDI